MNINTSKALFAQAQDVIPGGVNSPVRAFKAVGGDPVFFQSAKGAIMTDVDGNDYIDLINSWGPLILGHAHEKIETAVIEAVKNSLSFGAPTKREVDIAELIVEMVPSIEKVRMVNSGTEATMSAIRLARGFTQKEKIIKFDGCYHGHGDSFLIAAGSGAATFGIPNSPGVTQGVANDTLIAPFNNLDEVEKLLLENKNNVAAIILEPVAGNMGCVLPTNGFLQGLRKLCDDHGTLLIFDEVMTGFRLSKAGAQGIYNMLPDLTTFGKIIGGGMPVGAYGGKKEIMDFVSPQGPVYQAGTLSGNPVAMAAGYAMLTTLNEDDNIYIQLKHTSDKIVNGLQDMLTSLGETFTINQMGSMYCMFFTHEKVENFDDAKKSDTAKFGRYFKHMLSNGVYLPPSQYEAVFLSTAITDEHVETIIAHTKTFLEQDK